MILGTTDQIGQHKVSLKADFIGKLWKTMGSHNGSTYPEDMTFQVITASKLPRNFGSSINTRGAWSKHTSDRSDPARAN